VPDQPGLDQLQQRMTRASRTVPPPRRPAEATSPAVVSPPEDSSPIVETPIQTRQPESVAALGTMPQQLSPRPDPATTPGDADWVAGPGEAQANLAVRVRRSLDLRLDDLVHELRRSGTRSSKAELVELLLWELPPTLTADLADRLDRFRRVARRR
jgi:hypothetical protein